VSITWKFNGEQVAGPEAIPNRPAGLLSVRSSYKKPIELQSMGFLAHPDDVAEHRKRFPDIDLVMREGSAIPVVRSLGQKRSYFKRAGWVDTKSFT
jgi:hypothetical protein